MLDIAIICMAFAIHAEAKSEPLAGKYAVASVVFNRANQDKSKVCKVLTEPGQFQWVKKSPIQVSIHGGVKVDMSRLPTGALWDTSLLVSSEIIQGTKPYIPKVVHFHATHVNPHWKYARLFKIGKHWFYA